MPRSRERETLDQSGATEAHASNDLRLSHIGVRRITLPPRAGLTRAVEIDPTSFRCSRLAGQLADQWVDIASGLSRSVIEVHRQALVSYLNYVDEVGCSAASLDKRPAQVVQTLGSWTKSLVTQYDSTSTLPYRMSNVVQTQIAGAVADGIVIDDVLAAYAQGPALLPKRVAQPLDEFSGDELKQIVLAARAHVRAALKIREWAAAMINAAQSGLIVDPDQQRVASMLSAASTGEPVVRDPEWAIESLVDQFPAEAKTIYTQPKWVRAWCVRATMPTSIDLLAFRILLLAGTGVSADELSALVTSDIEWTDKGVRLQLKKSRARRSKGRFFAGGPDSRRWSVPGLLELLLAFTEPARAVTTEGFRDHVWLAVTDARRDSSDRSLPWPADFTRGRASFASWIALAQSAFGLGGVSTPHDLRRIRKTKVAERAIQFKGVMADIAGDDHTTKVFFTHYAHTTSLKVYSASVVSRFQTTLAEAVRTGFTAFTDKRSAVPLALLRKELPIDAGKARDIRSGALDMGVVDCRDPYDSPFTSEGKLCMSAPLTCLMCENAIVFTDHLPNIVALMSSMEAARRSMSPEEWITVWGASYDAARTLMGALPENVRDAAEQRAAQARTDLPIWMQKAGG